MKQYYVTENGIKYVVQEFVRFDGEVRYWSLNNDLHRINGPACEYPDGKNSWYYKGKYHREDGPAIEFADGSKEWYLHGKLINCSTQEGFEKLLKLKAFW